MKEITVYFDGGCISNPGGLGSWGYVIYRNGQRIHYDYGIIPNSTNNWSEYTALEKAMEFIIEHGIQGSIHVKGDSQLVIYQMKGEWRAYSNTSEHFIPRIKKMIEGRNVKFSWIPREENSEADRLTKIALKEYFKNMGGDA